jgi:hypothetical protein
MPTFSVRIPADLAARFDAAAAERGGRSARLRQLIGAAAREGAGPVSPASRRPAAVRLMVRLGPAEAAHVETHARAMGLRRAGWVAALVRRHALGTPALPRSDELAVLAIQAEVHRIGVNVNQIARALNTAVLEGAVLELELSEVAALATELKAHLLALREAFLGNLAYWDAAFP